MTRETNPDSRLLAELFPMAPWELPPLPKIDLPPLEITKPEQKSRQDLTKIPNLYAHLLQRTFQRTVSH